VLSACVAPASPRPASTPAASPQPVSTQAPSPQPASTQPAKSTGKLSSRMQQMVQSPQLRTASPVEQARALSLPADGPGSLVRDKEGRLLVEIRVLDTTTATLQALRDAGAVIADVAEAYQVVTAFARIDDLSAIAGLPAVQSVQEQLAPGMSGGAIMPTPP